MNVSVTIKGPLFDKDVKRIVEKQIVHEILGAVQERTERQGRGLGAQRNRIDHTRRRLTLDIDSTRIRPRTKGTAWVRKNMSVVRSMAPRVARKAAERICEELG